MLAEVVGGILSGSLALLADAAHMLTDAAALGLAWIAFRMARRPATSRMSYGFGRLQVLAAFANGISLFFVTGWIVYEAFHRLGAPVHLLGGPMLIVAVAGLLVNVLVFAILHGADRDNLNIRGALLHVLGDLLGSLAAILAAAIILWTGWTPADPLLSLLVALLVLVGAWRLVRDSAHILLEGAPHELEPGDIIADLESTIEAVEDVHHVHVWALTEERRLVTLHACIGEGADGDQAIVDIQARLKARFDIGHATVQIERQRC